MISFLQSDQWAKFQNLIGRETFKIDGIYVIKYSLPFGKSYLYSPRCASNCVSDSFIEKIKTIAKRENAIFFKMEPSYAKASEGEFEILLKNFKFKKSNNVQPLQTIVLDLTESEEELLNQMHPKTRYNINLAQKKEIKIRRGKTDDDFDRFWGLMQKTSQRDNFKSYSRAYYEEMLEIPEVELFLAEYKNEAIVANIVLFYENQAIYLHGASSYEYRNLMAPYLLQWEQIKEAKRIGCTMYDFWGINEQKWPGVTRFKRGFGPKTDLKPDGFGLGSDPNPESCRGGQEITYPGAYDLVFKPFWYKIYKLAKKIL
ncbi:MAG: peptidoglycan bridge formation glycyltransferase FemA/FemB family protein [Patescibacteria group bacterium]